MPETSRLLLQLGIDGPVARIDEALTHPSYANEHPLAVDYERLEFLGDAVLSLCVTELLLRHAPTADEGTLTRMRASLVNTSALADFARSISLSEWVRFGKGAARSGDALQPRVLACVVEAMIGAVYTDRGLEIARSLIERIVGESLKRTATISQRDPKSELQERVQSRGRNAPTYYFAPELSPDLEGCFHVEVRVDDDVLGYGQGRSKKAAEQSAARTVLIHMSRSKESS